MFHPFTKPSFTEPLNPFDDSEKTFFTITRSADNPVPWPDWAEQMALSRNLKNAVVKITGNPWFPAIVEHENLLESPHAIRYRFSSSGRHTHPDSVAPFRPWRIELARFSVPKRHVGIVRSFEQYMGEVGQGGINNVIVYGDPFVDTEWGIEGRWFMRLFPWNGEIRPWVNQVNYEAQQPGIPYTDFMEQSGVWYPAHSDSANSVRFTVPGGYELAVFWECDSTITHQPVVGSAFKGGVKSAISKRGLDFYTGAWS